MPANGETVQRFRAAIAHAFSQSTEHGTADSSYTSAVKPWYDTAMGQIVTVRDTDTLASLMATYLALCTRYAGNAAGVHYIRSDGVFAELFDRSTRIPSKARDLLGEWAAMLSGARPEGTFVGLKKRFDALNETDRSHIRVLIAARPRPSTTSRSILDVLKDLYTARGEKLRGYAQLYAFDPAPEPALRSQFDEQYGAVAAAWDAAVKDDKPELQKAFLKAFDDFRTFLSRTSKSGDARLFQVVKWLQDRIVGQRLPMPGRTGAHQIVGRDLREFVPELYAMACLQLLILANDKVMARNRFGFTDEEKSYFLAPLEPSQYRKYPYYADVKNRIATKLKSVPEVVDDSRAFLTRVLLARHHGFDVVDLDTTLLLGDVWLKLQELSRLADAGDTAGMERMAQDRTLAAALGEMATTSIHLSSGPTFSEGTVRAGDTLGEHTGLGTVTVVYIDPEPPNVIYVEFESQKPYLFKITPNIAAHWLFGARLVDLARSLEGVMYLVEIELLIVGFAPGLIEGGFAGLVQEVVIYLGGVAADKVVSEVNPTAGKIVGFLFQMFAPRMNFGRQPVGGAPPPTTTITDIREPPSLSELLRARDEQARLGGDTGRGVAMKLKPAGGGGKGAPSPVLAGDSPFPLEPERGGGGPFLRAADEPGQRGSGTPGRAGRGTASGPSAAAVEKLKRSKDYSALEKRIEYLDTEDQKIARNERDDILRQYERGTLKRGSAEKQLKRLLDDVKEATSIYVTDGFIWSNWDVRSVVDIPTRENGIDIIDRVYEVQNPKTGKVGYVFVEIKGGPRTRLGSVTKKVYVAEPSGVEARTVPGTVRQATPEWYYQKIMEIYNRPGAGNRALAERLFAAAKRGDVESWVVKMTGELEPIPTHDPSFSKWFRSKSLPSGARGAHP